MARNRFFNPATNETYAWPVNHNEEEETAKARNITRTAPTSGYGLVRQQGDDGPFLLKLSGTILDRAQLVAMWRWYAICRAQTIRFIDFDDQSYEVQITDFAPRRVRKAIAPRRDPSAPTHYWTYTITMEVYAFIAGDMVGAGVTP
jgi:hypothetical protein